MSHFWSSITCSLHNSLPPPCKVLFLMWMKLALLQSSDVWYFTLLHAELYSPEWYFTSLSSIGMTSGIKPCHVISTPNQAMWSLENINVAVQKVDAGVTWAGGQVQTVHQFKEPVRFYSRLIFHTVLPWSSTWASSLMRLSSVWVQCIHTSINESC